MKKGVTIEQIENGYLVFYFDEEKQQNITEFALNTNTIQRYLQRIFKEGKQ